MPQLGRSNMRLIAQIAPIGGEIVTKIVLSQTEVRLPDVITRTLQPGFPERTLENAVQFGDLDGQGIYFTLLKWYPGYMSAPHYYATDRLCVVISGTWWVNSGNDFEPQNCVPTPPGSFIRRVAMRHATTTSISASSSMRWRRGADGVAYQL